MLLRNIYTDRRHLARALPMRNAEGDIVKWFGSCTDIEDHKRAEEELVEKNQELERINHDLNSFAYAAPHDLKLPIVNMARIFAKLTRVAMFRDPEAPRMLEMFDRSLQQPHNTIQDQLDVVKVQRVKVHKLEAINLAPLTEDVQLSLQDLLRETDARLPTDFSLVLALPFTKSSLKSILLPVL